MGITLGQSNSMGAYKPNLHPRPYPRSNASNIMTIQGCLARVNRTVITIATPAGNPVHRKYKALQPTVPGNGREYERAMFMVLNYS